MKLRHKKMARCAHRLKVGPRLRPYNGVAWDNYISIKFEWHRKFRNIR